jgi:hypothetical protein
MKQAMPFAVTLSFLLASAGALPSCGDDEDGESDKTSDTGSGQDTGTYSDASDTTEDTDTTEETVTESQELLPECNSQGFAPVVETGRVSNIYGVEYLGFSSATMPYDQVVVRMKMVSGAYPAPGTYALEGADISKCTNCVIAGKSCGSDGCEKLYVGTFGDIVAETAGPYKKQMKGVLSGVVMEEIEQNPLTGATSVKPGGDVWCLDGFEYDAQVLSFADGTCPQPGVNCVGETVPDFTMTNCDSGEDVPMSEVMEGKKAMLYVLVTKWCSYCTTWMPQVAAYVDGLLDDGLEVAYVFGENNVNQAPTLDFCKDYANKYAKHHKTIPIATKFYMDHDGVSPFANFFEAMWIYPTADGGFGTPFNAIVNAQTSEYVWYGAGAVGIPAMESHISQLLGL